MHPDLRVRAKSIDPLLVGRRLREARIRAGLTQGEAAGTTASTAYISRIEAGTRRPSPEILADVATRLHVSVEELLAPEADVAAAAEVADRLRLELDYAELELRTGSAAPALAGARSVAEHPEATAGLRLQARYLRAQANEMTGDYDAAIAELEDLAGDDEDGIFWIRRMVALSRAYRDSGDLGRACDVGERAARRIDEMGLAATTEAVQLTVTVAAAYFYRGDVNHAVRMCQRALEAADAFDSPSARAAVYWNSSVFEAERGQLATALPLAEKAIALLDTTEDSRNHARLRSAIGLMQLKLDPPQAAPALDNLERGLSDLSFTSASEADINRARIGVAQAKYLLGQVEEAKALLDQCLIESGDAPQVRVMALVLTGRIAGAEGRNDVAVQAYRSAVLELSALGSDRDVAQLWYELAALFESASLVTDAMDAYRRAAASTGLTQPVVLHGTRAGATDLVSLG